MDMKAKEEWAAQIERILQAGDYPKLPYWIEKIQRDALQAGADVARKKHAEFQREYLDHKDQGYMHRMFGAAEVARELDALMPKQISGSEGEAS